MIGMSRIFIKKYLLWLILEKLGFNIVILVRCCVLYIVRFYGKMICDLLLLCNGLGFEGIICLDWNGVGFFCGSW